MTHRIHPHGRRAWLLAAPVAALLAACGGGDFDSAPQITRFESSTTVALVGESVRLRAEFLGGSGRIDPDIGAVTSGATITTPPLDREREFQLRVERLGSPAATRTLRVGVRFRDRYQLGATPFAASQHAAVAAADGSVLLIGGSRGEFTISDAIERFDPATGQIRRIGTLPPGGRALASATRLANGQILLAGGVSSSTDWRRADFVDERTGLVTPAGSLSVVRVEHAAVRLADGRVLVTGGHSAGEQARLGVSDSAEIWEPSTGTFRRLARPMRIARASHSATLLPDGRVLIAGGYSTAAGYVFGEIFDPRDESFTALPDVQPLRALHAALATDDGRVLLLGGETAIPGEEEPLPTASVLRFDPATLRFTRLPSLTLPRTMVRAALLPDGRALLFGGQHQLDRYAESAELYDPALGGRQIAALDGERALHTVTRLASGRVAVIGGERKDGGWAQNVLIYE
jgi:Galactose oxidase, central domain